jgi:hypothetical protein
MDRGVNHLGSLTDEGFTVHTTPSGARPSSTASPTWGSWCSRTASSRSAGSSRAACGELIEEACAHLADAYEPHLPDTTALALAIAWWRCAKAVGP